MIQTILRNIKRNESLVRVGFANHRHIRMNVKYLIGYFYLCFVFVEEKFCLFTLCDCADKDYKEELFHFFDDFRKGYSIV